MATRENILRATAELLAESESGEVSTRAICERAGVGAPALYRNFGDKEGLIAAVVAAAFDGYLGPKRSAVPHDDPVVDLREGWDSHVRWALENPAYYVLIYGAGTKNAPPAIEANRLLRAVLDRCAADGRLKVSAEFATELVMAANVGVALNLVRFPELYRGIELSDRMRDVIHAAVLSDEASPETTGGGVGEAASTLQARLAGAESLPTTPAETAVLVEWLERLANDDA